LMYHLNVTARLPIGRFPSLRHRAGAPYGDAWHSPAWERRLL
jgi:hypothetical protein